MDSPCGFRAHRVIEKETWPRTCYPGSTTRRTWTEVPVNRAPSGRCRALSGKRPGVTGGRGVTPRPAGCSRLSLADPPEAPPCNNWRNLTANIRKIANPPPTHPSQLGTFSTFFWKTQGTTVSNTIWIIFYFRANFPVEPLKVPFYH
jgi:hypothetical protein